MAYYTRTANKCARTWLIEKHTLKTPASWAGGVVFVTRKADGNTTKHFRRRNRRVQRLGYVIRRIERNRVTRVTYGLGVKIRPSTRAHDRRIFVASPRPHVVSYHSDVVNGSPSNPAANRSFIGTKRKNPHDYIAITVTPFSTQFEYTNGVRRISQRRAEILEIYRP